MCVALCAQLRFVFLLLCFALLGYTLHDMTLTISKFCLEACNEAFDLIEYKRVSEYVDVYCWFCSDMREMAPLKHIPSSLYLLSLTFSLHPKWPT